MTTAAVPWYADEAGFAAELDRGRRTELRVVLRILPLGLWVKVDAPWFRENGPRSDPRSIDQADILVEGGHLLEVKGRRFRFTGPEDYPHGTAFVGAQRVWQERTVDPCSVVIVSEPTGALVIVAGASRFQWKVEEPYDQRRGIIQPSYAAPRALLLPEAALLEHLSRPCRWCPE